MHGAAQSVSWHLMGFDRQPVRHGAFGRGGREAAQGGGAAVVVSGAEGYDRETEVQEGDEESGGVAIVEGGALEVPELTTEIGEVTGGIVCSSPFAARRA